MSIFKTITSCMCVMIALASYSKAKEWKGIVPLHSTRTDVELLLGLPTEPRGSIYKTENENVSIWYAEEPCKRDGPVLWNVPRDTVLSITIYPRVVVDIGDLRLEEGKYRKETNLHREGITYYTDNEEGFRVETFEGKVRSFTYTAAAKDNHLRCPGTTIASGDNRNIHAPRIFDIYYGIPFKDEKERLDNFAIHLQQQPLLKGYIVVYAGRRAQVGEAKRRAERAKKYLVDKHNIEAGRIVTIDGGYREDLEVELYALPPNLSAPIPTPTLDPERSTDYQSCRREE